jgi:hypothetical protein
MTQDEIIEMARQAELTKTIDCCGVANKFCSQDQWKGNLSIFAKLVAQHEREGLTDAAMKAAEKAVDVAIALEREACAKLCEGINDGTPYNQAIECADAIRARGQA